MKRFVLGLIALVLLLPAKAQDSLARHEWTYTAIGGGIIAASGTIARFAPHKFQVYQPWHSNDHAATVLQFVPLASVWALKGFGIPTRDSWGQMAVNQGLSAAINAALVYGIKGNVDALRPDGEDYRSFPSGHSAWAFMGATVVARELGQTSAWYPLGAYTLATSVAASRVLQRRHLPSDVLAGAGIGILATQVGYALGDLISGNRQSHFEIEKDNDNFSFLSVSMGMSVPLGRINYPGGKLCRLPALTASMKAGLAIDDNWGVTADVGLISTPIVAESGTKREYAGPHNQVGGVIGPYYSYAFSRRLSLHAEVAGGYYRNLNMKNVGQAITPGSGTWAARALTGVSMRFTDHFAARLSLGYQLSRYHFDLSPSDEYGILSHAVLKGTASNFLVSLSSKYEF